MEKDVQKAVAMCPALALRVVDGVHGAPSRR
jgi:hypothetical protein